MKRAAVSVGVVVLVTAGCGGPADRSSAIAAEIGGGAECTATDYGITSKLDHSKTRIYDCTVESNPVDANGNQTFGSKRMCVTEENGIANDSTTIVKLLFASALSGGKPSCLGG